jgi:hypothetical protein
VNWPEAVHVVVLWTKVRCVERNTPHIPSGFTLLPICYAIPCHEPPHALFCSESCINDAGGSKRRLVTFIPPSGQPLNYESNLRRAGIVDRFVLFAICDLDSPALGVSAYNCRPWRKP